MVAKLRGLMHERRAGHSGTLDPMATGLLAVFFGRATRAVEFAEADEKEYIAGIRFGLCTDTQDITGTVIGEKTPDFTAEQLDEVLARFRGEISQLPPMYSAVKVGGKKLYEIARKGGQAERKPRQITVSRLERAALDGNETALYVTCSKGTYIRTLCHDIGQALGCGACMSSLHRTRAGRFTIDMAYSMEEIAAAAQQGRGAELLLPVDMLFSDLEEAALTPKQEQRLKNGGGFSCALAEGRFRAYGPGGEFLALVEVKNGELRAVKSFYDIADTAGK